MARDIGRAIFEAQKPDGTATQQRPFPSHLSTGNATRLLGDQVAKATDAIQDGKSTAYTDPKKPLTIKKNLENLVENPLEQFASYAPLWTMACLTKEQFNDPRTYRNSTADLKNIIFSSGGRFDEARTPTVNGVPEYFISNFTMRSTIAATAKAGNSNVFAFDFEIYEPYSMGLLLQSLQAAAINSGFANYLNNAPYLLRLDFQGYDELGKVYTSVKPKFFTLKLVTVKFEVNEGGSLYKVKAVPYNHQGFSDSINVAYNDLKLVSGEQGNVEEILRSGSNSLKSILNRMEEDLVNEKRIGVADIYDIQFPETSGEFQGINGQTTINRATQDPNEDVSTTTVQSAYIPSLLKSNVSTASEELSINEIGNASLGFDQSSGGNYAFKKHGDVYDEKTGTISRDKMTIDPKKRSFQFAQSQTLTAIINQVILSSQYAKNALDPKNMVNDHIKWFRLDVQIELLDFDTLIGDYARKITYRVVPFLIHHTIFSNPNSMPAGYDQIQKKISKEYNYIYTGQNVDVLSFDIQINNLFFTGNNPSAEKDSANVGDQNTQGVAYNAPQNTETTLGPAPGAQVATLGRARVKRDPDLLDKPKGGSGNKSTEQLVAESFHKAFIKGSSGDLITVSLEILGDPYWLVDSGISNYFTQSSSPTDQITADGTMNYESGSVYVYLTFATPVDINEKTGLYDFPVVESPFSGIYRVIQCDNVFDDGKFTQKIQCVRMPSQDKDFAASGAELQNLESERDTALAISITDEQQARVTVGAPVIPSILTNSAGVASRSNALPGQSAVSDVPVIPSILGGSN